MSKKKSDQDGSNGTGNGNDAGKGKSSQQPGFNVSRRGFLGSAAVGTISAAGLGFNMGRNMQAEAHGRKYGHGGYGGHHHHKPPKRGHGSRDRILLKGGIVLSLDPAVGDFKKADVLVEGKKIVAVRPNIHAHARVIDCTGLVVMPGFITTHHHQYETVQRALIADGYITFGQDPGQPEHPPAVWPYEDYRSVVQAIWTTGAYDGWDLGAPPQHPEDCYISELVASLAQITQGITCATDTSQASHTPEHTDAMIKGLMDSGARALFDYSSGSNRGPSTGYEWPGKMGDTTVGVGRLKKEFFSSDDQLVTLGLGANQNPVTNPDGTTESYTGWELAKSFGCWINNHNVGGKSAVTDPANQALLDDPEIGPRLTLVHCVRWQDNEIAQVGADKTGYPNAATSEAWQIAADKGVHVSIAAPLEAQMRHGMPPIQMALNHGIMPSLSPDVDTNQSSDPFTLMRGAFNLQRGLANDLAFDLSDPGRLIAPQTLTCRQVLEMATIAGAAGSGLLHKVGTLTPGKEADIICLESHSIDIAPMNNAPGAVVTLMDTSHVKHVMIAGEFKYWNYELVGWNVDKLVKAITRARDNMLERIRAVPMPQPGNNTPINPYRPPFLTSCCYVGQNNMAPHYNLRP
jgi:5-methylthioadenosine/S-adenosylhomocysteine deaminase